MKNIIQNKFEVAHFELIDFCISCQSVKKLSCDPEGTACDKMNFKLNDLYYDILYPFHPCSKCIVRPKCTVKCDTYSFYYHSRRIATCEHTDSVIYFTSDRNPVITGPRLVFTEDYIKDNPGLNKTVDFDATAKYITEIKNSDYYRDLLNTVGQYLDYTTYIENNRGSISFQERFF